MRILVVEDEKKLAGFIRQALREDGHAVDACYNGEEATHMVTTNEYDAVVLDLQLPDRDGFSVVREMRQRGLETPVVILTARQSVKDRVRGLDEGADDYLTKPFALAELRARVRAVLRRGQGSTPVVLRFADLTLNIVERAVTRGERKLQLTSREFSLLEYFLRNPGRVLTRTSIAEHVWDYNFECNSNVVDVFVNNVRRKTEEADEARLIHTIRGAGYVLREGDEDVG